VRDRSLACGLLAWVLLGAISCGGSEPGDARGQLADDLIRETDGRLDRSAADCVAAALHDDFGEDSYREVLDAASGRGDGDSEAGVRRRVIDAFSGCDALGQIAGTPP
jgi:hypothetical protein